MKIFIKNQEYFATKGITRHQATQSYPFNSKNLLEFLKFCLCVVLFAGFLICEANSFQEYVKSTYYTSGVITVSVGFILFVWNVDDFFKFVDGWEKCVEQRSQYPASKCIYTNIFDLMEKLDRLVILFVNKLTPGVVFLKCIVSYYKYFTIGMKNDTFELVVPMWFPFDWKNPIGFLITAIITYMFAVLVMPFVGHMLSIGIGTNLYLVSFTKDIGGILMRISESGKTTSSQRSIQIVKHIIEYVEFHTKAKELSQCQRVYTLVGYFVGYSQPIFVAIFVWSLITICGVVIMIQMEITNYENSDFMMLFETIIEAFYAIFVVFITSELGERLTIAYDEMDCEIERFDWYLFPIEIQQTLLILMIVAQQSIAVQCFGSFTANRETFKKVMKSTYSYYTVLRQFY